MYFYIFVVNVGNINCLQNFIIPLAATGFYLAAEYTPVLSDGVIGEAAVVFSESLVTSKIHES